MCPSRGDIELTRLEGYELLPENEPTIVPLILVALKALTISKRLFVFDQITLAFDPLKTY